MGSYVQCVGNSLIMLLLALDITTEGCEPGFFGKDCKYACFCTSYDKCTETGSCSDGKCASGHFDNACQTYDSLAKYHSQAEEALYDNDDNTCVAAKTTYQAAYVRRIMFSWMRIVFEKDTDASYVGKGMTVEINSKACKTQTFRPVGNTLDLFCNQADLIEMNMFKLTFPMAVGLCSIYTSYEIDERLKGFIFETKDENNQTVQMYRDKDVWVPPSYKISLLPKYGRYRGTTSAKITVPNEDGVLIVCEVNVFGEYFHGGPCIAQGNCKPDLICKNNICQCPDPLVYDFVYKSCTEVLFGTVCNLDKDSCRETQVCLSGTCGCKNFYRYNKTTDRCDLPLPLGARCEKTGFYVCTLDGMFCESESSTCVCNTRTHYPHNDIVCLPKKQRLSTCQGSEECGQNTSCINRTCQCQPEDQHWDLQLLECREKCAAGMFGQYCKKICPTNCEVKFCDYINGTCTKGCTIGHFGDKCEKHCPSDCRNNMCYQSSGDCVYDVGCTNDAECYRPKERCYKGKCICSTTFYFEPATRSCELQRPLKDPCQLRESCAPGSTCVHGKCECDPEKSFYDKQTGLCFQKTTVNAGCNSTETCAPDLVCEDNTCKCPFTLVYNNETRKCHTRHVPVPLFGSLGEKISVISILVAIALYLAISLVYIHRTGRKRFLKRRQALAAVSRNAMLRAMNRSLSDEELMPGETAV